MKGKRHWWNQYDLLAPFKNIQKSIKDSEARRIERNKYKTLAELRKEEERFNKVLVIIVVVIALIYGANKVIAYQVEYQNIEKMEIMRLEKEAILKEERERMIRQTLLQQEDREKQKQKKQDDEMTFAKNYTTKEIKKSYPIGTYIKVNDDWIGKIKRIDGDEIFMTDGWECNYTTDKIEYASYKEYKQFIKENSKG